MSVDEYFLTEELKREIDLASEASKNLVNKIQKQAEEIGYSLSPDVDCEKGGHPYIVIVAHYTSLYSIRHESGTKNSRDKLDALIPKTFNYKKKNFPVEPEILSYRPSSSCF